MHLLPNCIDDLKYSDFWKNTEEPSLNKFLNFRLHQGNLEESEVEHRRYKDELKSISKYYDKESEIGKKVLIWKQKFQRDKTRQRLLEERCKLLEKEQTEMEEKMCLKQTQHILNVTRETVDQGLSLQRSIVENFKKRVLDEPYASCEPSKRRIKVTNSNIIAESYSESDVETDITEDNDIIAGSHSESDVETDITEDNDIIAGSHSESYAETDITEDSNIIAGSHSEFNEETDTEVINITEDNAEIESLTLVEQMSLSQNLPGIFLAN
ncbi:unnamed protein product [Rhizophagus irregularis]|nr:unnamed protein product [Rhizophagus irregularis]CAB5342570.1 unnamed protein product [Rhizophagus irregularis]